jgi:hypothetical protein
VNELVIRGRTVVRDLRVPAFVPMPASPVAVPLGSGADSIAMSSWRRVTP